MVGQAVQDSLVPLIQQGNPDWSPEGYICLDDLDRFRAQYIREAAKACNGELSTLSAEIIQNLKDEEIQAANLNTQFDQQLTTGEHIADQVAEFGGSWKFIIIFGVVLFLWILINAGLLFKKPFDPYPFILLNLILSCIAAIQAPVIMMSQNRQETKDRLRAENDYRVNLKAELEIRHLHEKLDFLLVHQLQRMMEVQRIQSDLLDELRHARTVKRSPDS